MTDRSLHQNSKPEFPQSFGTIPESLAQEYASQSALFEAQPTMIQRFLEAQASPLAEALIQRASQARFVLPDRVVVDVGSAETQRVSAQFQEQTAGGFIDSLRGSDIRVQVRQRLSELEGSENDAAAAAAGLIRYATAIHMVHNVLPSGRSVTYVAADDEEIPTQPVRVDEEASAITADTDAIVEEAKQSDRGELIVPYVPYARRFYLPQWVAFDEEGHLLGKSVQEAEGHIASMQRFLEILHASVGLAPYMIADPEYQRKRYGMLGQLINQGRALALYQTHEIVQAIKRRAAANELNRGLSLSLPYFDDQDLTLKLHDFQVIPAGRIMFVPAFVVRAAGEEQAKVAQDTRLSPSTRKYLLNEIELLGQAFLPDFE